MVSISDDKKDNWEVFSRVQQILNESGFSKEALSVTVANTSTYAPIADALSMITQLIEREGYAVDKLYVDPQKGIVGCTDTSLQLELYEAICTFKDTGATEKLKKLIGKISDPIMVQLLNRLVDFSENLNLCQVNALEPILAGIYENLDILEHSTSAADNFIRIICNKLRTVFGDSKPKLSTMCFISCSIGWKWTTQSLIMFVDVLPKELVSKKIVECDFSNSISQTPEMDLFFTHLTKDIPIPKEEEIKELLISFLKGWLENDSRKLFINEFADIIRKFEKRMSENNLTIPYKGIDILLSCGNPENEGIRQLIDHIKNEKFSTMSQFRRCLEDNINDIPYFFKDPLRGDKNVLSQKILGIKYLKLENIRTRLKGFKLNIDYGKLSCFKRFLALFLYLKMVRNIFCHALPISLLDNEFNDRQRNELSRLGVDTGIVTADSVLHNISKALECLGEFLVTKQERVSKKYYMAIPDSCTVYEIELKLRSLFENVSCYDMVKVYVIKNETTSDKAERAFRSELEEFSICNDFFYDIETIDDSGDPSKLLNRLTKTVIPGDIVNFDCSDITIPQMCAVLLFFKAALEAKAKVGKVECGEHCLNDLINSQFAVKNI